MDDASSMNKHIKLYTSRPQKQGEEEFQGELYYKKPCYILQLQDHIIAEIFCKIPIKTLIQCRRVCKSWRCLLSDPEFTKYLFSGTPTCLLLQVWNDIASHHFRLVDLSKASNPNPNDIVLKEFSVASGVRVVGSCNGLLCLVDMRTNDGYFYIANPIIGESLALPRLNKIISLHSFIFGFGYCPIFDVYKVVVITFPSEGSESVEEGEIMVLTVGSEIWKSIGKCVYPDLGGVCKSYGTYLNGFLHWTGQSSKSGAFICAFEVGSENFQQFPLPPCPLEQSIYNHSNEFLSKNFFRLGVLRGWLSLSVCMDEGYLEIWVMKDYGVKGCWTKVVEILGPYATPRLHVLKLTDKGTVLSLYRTNLRAFTPPLDDVRVEGLEVLKAFVYTPSFLSPKDVIRG